MTHLLPAPTSVIQAPRAAIAARPRGGSEHGSLCPFTGMAALGPSLTATPDLGPGR